MRVISLAVLCLVATSAAAESLVPAAEFIYSFGSGKSIHNDNYEFRLSGYTSHFSDVADSTDRFLESDTRRSLGKERLNLLVVKASSYAPPKALLLGIPLNKSPTLAEAGNEPSSTGNWLWVGLGVAVAAVIAGVALSGSGSGGQKNSNQNSGCNGVTGDSLIPPSNIKVGSGC